MIREVTPRRLVMKKSGTDRYGKGTHSEEIREEHRRRCEFLQCKFLQSDIASANPEETPSKSRVCISKPRLYSAPESDHWKIYRKVLACNDVMLQDTRTWVKMWLLFGIVEMRRAVPRPAEIESTYG